MRHAGKGSTCCSSSFPPYPVTVVILPSCPATRLPLSSFLWICWTDQLPKWNAGGEEANEETEVRGGAERERTGSFPRTSIEAWTTYLPCFFLFYPGPCDMIHVLSVLLGMCSRFPHAFDKLVGNYARLACFDRGFGHA